MQAFAPRLIAWQAVNGRHDLPWQVTDPYRVWLSEIMLQQTQVETVIPYYLRFLARFPNLAALAGATEDDVLAAWSGLGYYARARQLHAAARLSQARHGGVLPTRFEDLIALPGIGRSTAAAIAVFTRGERRAILDGNVKRVLCRVFGVEGWPGERTVEARLWQLAESLLPECGITAYTQGLMDLGATLCTRARPACTVCPFADLCVAQRQGRVSELPGARPRKALPERSTRMLVCVHAGSVLLEKRPSSGIWGGLWSLPEISMRDDPVREASAMQLVASDPSTLPVLAHAFTHFRLRIEPVLLRVTALPGAQAPGRVWLPLVDMADAALPTPVRRILAALPGGGTDPP